MASRTACSVSGRSLPGLVSTSETVDFDTPAARAMSMIVTLPPTACPRILLERSNTTANDSSQELFSRGSRQIGNPRVLAEGQGDADARTMHGGVSSDGQAQTLIRTGTAFAAGVFDCWS